MQKDPIKEIEEIVHVVHDRASRYTQPVLVRYPLLFTFLIVFSAAAILDGFRLVTDGIPIFKDHPIYLILIGVIALLLTGKLYESLEKMK
jgi:uncharacterized membrane protein